VSQALIAALQNPALYPHPVEGFQVIETHISWVLLTGPYAYKVKKPVNFGFLDFTDLASRQHFCNEELRLNQRLAPSLYREVLPICGSEQAPRFGDDAPVIEYALKMRQFPQSQLLAELQSRGELRDEHIDALADLIARFHLQAPRVPVEHALGTPEAVMAPVQQNFDQIRPLLTEAADLAQLDTLEHWAQSTYQRLHPLLVARKTDGFIRECHGDIHLGNVTLLDGEVMLFDCIEFNEPFRLTDVVADSAFLTMDLESRGLKELARRFVNRWLELTGDYTALELLNFYKAYRALVRAKINLLSLSHEPDVTCRATALAEYRRYANLAEQYSAIPSRFMAITHGVAGVGKSHVSLRLVEELGAVRLRSDVERKRLFGTQPAEQQGQLSAGIYQASASQATYQRLNELASLALRAGYPAVLDAAFLKRDQRDGARRVAEDHGVPFLLLDCQAPEGVLEQRLAQRLRDGGDPSDATLEVMHAQQASQEPLAEDELARQRVINTHDGDGLEQALAELRQRLPGL
jgi:aminoglycoside phosphotransferase family enzyme/predicted kinase